MHANALNYATAHASESTVCRTGKLFRKGCLYRRSPSLASSALLIRRFDLRKRSRGPIVSEKGYRQKDSLHSFKHSRSASAFANVSFRLQNRFEGYVSSASVLQLYQARTVKMGLVSQLFRGFEKPQPPGVKRPCAAVVTKGLFTPGAVGVAKIR